ncbi:hypothetical protein DB88DRAFT_484100 [Papiliotrema laurentii]|uniref:Guanosine-3',5'-bis(diphosphate) 3'-pyrophosphohydrolase MESH1 n=1 Tax=Papiliotrema laurentii TaxID=5418 RepID=A0AAD9FSK2_PAPLA|nr:hypothetical protein DB88DRAFT_484100 [Papiliotrema laurentii]
MPTNGIHESNTDSPTSASSPLARPFHFPSNTPGSAIDLTEIAGLTPTIPFAQLHDDDPSPPGSRPLSMVGKCSRQTTEGRAGCRDPAREPVEVEMGGGMGDLAVLLRTIDFAAQKHSSQRRKDVDQTPYINHPIAVSNFLAATGVTDIKVLQAAILHDTVEDTHTTLEEIAVIFGPDVARIVEECTDNTTLSGQERKAEQVRTAPFKSREAQMVKLADKLHNLESIRRSPPVGWGVRRVQAYFIWAKQVTDLCAAAHPRLAARLQHLYETAYTRINGKYHPCHPEVCGPLTEEEKLHIDSRLSCLKDGETPCPKPIFF